MNNTKAIAIKRVIDVKNTMAYVQYVDMSCRFIQLAQVPVNLRKEYFGGQTCNKY